jgi:NAD(P)H-dependent flavin oxidoreductase YrpB (nitropropane dioxygenase family)
MNGVSDIGLALAVNRAGAMPSLMIPMWKFDPQHHSAILRNALDRYTNTAGNSQLLLVLNNWAYKNPDVLELVTRYKISHVEYWDRLEANNTLDQSDTQVMAGVQYLNDCGVQHVTRIFDPEPQPHPAFAALGLKGSDSAGLTGQFTVRELFDRQRQLTPDTALIPYGGVGTAEQVQSYMTAGAAAVAVGTLFAMSAESCLAPEVKQRMVSAQAGDVQSLPGPNTKQNALVLGDSAQVLSDTSENRQHSLENGIHGQGGLVYAGAGIQHVNQILPVQDIVEYLVSDLAL